MPAVPRARCHVTLGCEVGCGIHYLRLAAQQPHTEDEERLLQTTTRLKLQPAHTLLEGKGRINSFPSLEVSAQTTEQQQHYPHLMSKE